MTGSRLCIQLIVAILIGHCVTRLPLSKDCHAEWVAQSPIHSVSVCLACGHRCSRVGAHLPPINRDGHLSVSQLPRCKQPGLDGPYLGTRAAAPVQGQACRVAVIQTEKTGGQRIGQRVCERELTCPSLPTPLHPTRDLATHPCKICRLPLDCHCNSGVNSRCRRGTPRPTCGVSAAAVPSRPPVADLQNFEFYKACIL